MDHPDNNFSLSLCAGAGGLDIGLEAAGLRTIAQIEMDKDCVQTLSSYRHKHRSACDVVSQRLEDVPPAALRRRLGLRRGQLAVLAGGPPCQPFTTHGLRQAMRDGRAAGVFPSYLNFVREFMPHAAVMENVDGLLSAALVHRPLTERGLRASQLDEMKGAFLRWLVSELTKLGYAVSWGLVEAVDFGVPQYRQRALLIAVRSEEPCYLPTERPNADRKTLRDALKNIKDPGPIQPLSQRKRDIYKLIPSGGNWRNLSPGLQASTMGAAYKATGGKGGWWRRLSWDEPAPTILGMPDHSSTGLVHPDEVRCLGLNECAAIQTFPKGMLFSGTPRSQYQQVGNAVPPKLGKAIGQQLLRHLSGKRPKSPPLPPEWRQSSANRRIGTHGWAIATVAGMNATLNVKVRDDHIWAVLPEMIRRMDDRFFSEVA